MATQYLLTAVYDGDGVRDEGVNCEGVRGDEMDSATITKHVAVATEKDKVSTYITRTKNIFFNEQKVGMLLQKRTDTRGVGISSMRKSIYLLTTTPSSHTHRFHPLPLATPASCSPHPLVTPIHSTHSSQLSSIL